MRAVIQRVSRASVTTEKGILSQIGTGLIVFIGIENADSQEDVDWLGKKLVQLRIFNDSKGMMNLSVQETGGDIIVVSQFTLHAKTKKGNRPSYINSARPEIAIPIYEKFIEKLSTLLGKEIGTGEFGAMMSVEIINEGPVTIIIDTKNKDL